LFNDGLSIACTSDAVVAETLYKPYQANDTLRVSEFKEFFNNGEFITVLADALHYATAAIAGCKFLLTNDHGLTSSDAVEVIYLDSLLGK
jgi:predicted nucleic acid-binding protein